MNKFDRALVFAYNAHRGQYRKYSGEPYICHPIAVASILEKFGYSEDVQIAALFHDILEDTTTTFGAIVFEFSIEIAKLVMEVTDQSKSSDGNRAIRKTIDREHIINASLEGKAIKLADLIDNTKSIVAYDKDFAKIYLKEKALLLDILKDCNGPLLAEAYRVYNEAYNILMFS